MDENLMTISDLAKKTQLPKSWWYSQTRQAGEGAVPQIRCGKYIRFEWPQVEAWLKTLDQKKNK